MAKIVGINSLSQQELSFEVQRGGRFVQYPYCVSAVVITFKRGTDIYFVRAGESKVGKGIGWTLLTFVAGWWGIPWGPIYTVQSLWYNLKGGYDVTPAAAKALGLSLDWSSLFPEEQKASAAGSGQ